MKIKTITQSIVKTDSKNDSRQSPEVKDENRTIYRMFYQSSRYVIDFAEDFKEGWEQFDTDQDAPYFGCWINKKAMLTLCYAEGDWSMVVCKTKESFNLEIKEMCEFYLTTPEFIAISEDGINTFYQNRNEFYIK